MTSEMPSQAQPATTSRSVGRCVSACVRSARCAEHDEAADAEDEQEEGGRRAAGRGRRHERGHGEGERPSVTMATASTACSASSGAIRRGRRRAGSAVSASSAAPVGSDTPPASAITPFGPTSTPGVAKPWTASSAVVVENAVPSRIARPSRARTPAVVTPIATSSAVPAVATTGTKWALPLQLHGRVAGDHDQEQRDERDHGREQVAEGRLRTGRLAIRLVSAGPAPDLSVRQSPGGRRRAARAAAAAAR